ncbi:MAG: hypothetical protein WDA22_01465 [Bacteroidota bacterium]
MDIAKRNLQSLITEYHDKGGPARGLNNIQKFFQNNQDKQLAYFLRFHVPDGVYGAELTRRFEVDALFEFYNLLLVAVFSGYVPPLLNEEIKLEIQSILDHPSVKPYYTKHYPYTMCSVTLNYIHAQKPFIQKPTPATLSIFNEFISLNRYLKNDEDIEMFINMLDHVWYDDDTIDDVNDILRSFEKLKKAFLSKEKTEAQSGVWGFIKYSAFLSQLKQLMKAAKDYPLLQSALWLYHGYYLERMSTTMKSLFNKAFNNLEQSIQTPNVFDAIVKELYPGQSLKASKSVSLRKYAEKAIRQSRRDVNFVLNKKWGNKLKKYLKQ